LIRGDRARAAEAKRVTERDEALKKDAERAKERDVANNELKNRLGISNMLLASAAYDNRDVVLAAERLDDVPPEQRGWEWRYLKQQTRGGLFTLYGHTGPVSSVSFSPDGTRIVTGSFDQTAKVWDARAGKELKGEPIPPATQPVQISPDGRWIAHAGGNRVELIPMQPDAEELEYRRIQTRPNLGRYREGYDAAIQAKDDFAARFYLGLLAPDRTRQLAEAIVAPLFARLQFRDDVLAALRAQPAADLEIQAACVELAGTWPESAASCNDVAWPLVRDPGGPDAIYQRGLRLAMAACRLQPGDGFYLNTLGVAQYRCGLVAEALATLTRSNDLNKENEPADLAFLALAQSRLDQSEKARSTLGRLRKVMKNPARAGDQEAQAFLCEAETIELDQVFPADPFAP
jgi:hypothetical protein